MSLWDKNKKVIMKVLESIFLGPFIIFYNCIKEVMKSLFKALMLLVIIITVTSCSPNTNGDFIVTDRQYNYDKNFIVTDGHYNYYTNSYVLENNTVKFTDADNNHVIINGNFTIRDNKCSSCEESEKE